MCVLNLVIVATNAMPNQDYCKEPPYLQLLSTLARERRSADLNMSKPLAPDHRSIEFGTSASEHTISPYHFANGNIKKVYNTFTSMTNIVSLNNTLTNATTHRRKRNVVCPRNPLGHVMERAYCPWEYIVDHDVTRFPQDLAFARCKCRRCRNRGRALCETVRYSIIVLQKTGRCPGGVHQYISAWKEVPVACACARPSPSS